MSSLAFDTHRVVKRLTEAGFSSTQAETVTDVLLETRTFDLSELATKADLRSVETGSKADLRTLEANFKAELRTVEGSLRADIRSVDAKIADTARMTLQWVLGLFVAQIAVIAGLIKLLAGH